MIRYIKAYVFKKYDHTWTGAPEDKTGLEKFIFVNDFHVGSKYQDNPNALDILLSLKNDGKTFLNGDIFDLSCCAKNDANLLRNFQTEFIHKFDRHFQPGNHCLPGSRTGLPQFSAKPMIFTSQSGKRWGVKHGHQFGKSKEKWAKYEKQQPGASKLKLLAVSLLDDLDHVKAGRPLTEGFIEDAAQWCIEHDVDGIVCGHFHPEAERRYSYLGKTIIVLPAHKVNEVWL